MILDQIPDPVIVEPVMEKYPVKYEESMNTVLVQEIIKYNRLLNVRFMSNYSQNIFGVT